MANRSLSSEEYWRQREATAREQAISRADGYASDIKDIYTRMLSNTQTQINDFYTKYATSEGITMAEARKKVSKLDIAAYEAKAKKYVQMARDGSAEAFSERANEEMKLYNLTMKVNRLEMLKSQIGLELVAGNAELEKYFGDTLNSEALAEYRRQSGILGESVIAPASRAKEIVSGSFQSATYSERIWSHQDALKTEIGQKLQQAIISGRGARSVATEISKIFGTSQYNAERLMRTEIRRIQTEVAKDVMEQNGNEEYEYMALGPKPCPICSDLSGQIFKVKSMVPGKNAPPMHPMCMCATAPYWDEAKYQAWLNNGAAEEGISYDEYSGSKIEYMSNSFRPRYGAGSNIVYGTNNIPIKPVHNSNFNMVTDESNSRRNKAVRLVESTLRNLKNEITRDVKIPRIAVVDFIKNNIRNDAIGGYEPENGILYINSIYDTKNKIIAYITKAPGYFANSSAEAPFLHELGHVFHYESVENIANAKGISYNEANEEVIRIVKEEVKALGESRRDLGSALSLHAKLKYSDQEYGEVIAEAFSVDRKNPFATRLLDRIEGEYHDVATKQ